MRALVVGYGASGARHARLLEGLGHEIAVVSRRKVEAARVHRTVAEAIADFAPAYAVVASRTDEHSGDVAALADAGFRGMVLVEKPLFERAQALPENDFAGVFVAYNLRFHPALRRFKEILDQARPYAVHAYVGHDLSKWWPDKDYRMNFRAKRAEGGGALRDLSHELDYLNWMLGSWTRLTALGGHVSRLETDSDDVFSLLFETRRCPVVSAQLNYLDSTLRREVLALTDKGTLRADLVAGSVEFAGDTESFDVDRDHTFAAEHRAALAGGGDLCTVDEGLAVVRMVEAAERAAAGHQWIAA